MSSNSSSTADYIDLSTIQQKQSLYLSSCDFIQDNGWYLYNAQPLYNNQTDLNMQLLSSNGLGYRFFSQTDEEIIGTPSKNISYLSSNYPLNANFNSESKESNPLYYYPISSTSSNQGNYCTSTCLLADTVLYITE